MIALKALIRQRHLSYEAFCREWDRVARSTDDALTGRYPGRAQYYRWLRGELANKRPYPDACRMLEAIFPGWPVESLFSAYNEAASPRAMAVAAATSPAECDANNGDGERENARPERSPATADLCELLTDYGLNLVRFSSVQKEEIPLLSDLEREVKVTFSVYQQGRFTSAASRATMLLADAQIAAQQSNGTESPRTQKLLALSYQAAASVLTKVGESDLALLAAERGLNAADLAADPSVRASLIRCVAFTLHSTGRFEPAMKLVDSGTDYILGEVKGNNAVALSVYGTLFLVGSMAAARFGDGSRTAEYLREADRAAQRLGRDGNHLWTAFGPTNVAIHHVNTAAELGNFQTVLDSGLALNTEAVPAERRVRCLLDVARAYGMTGNRDDALATILAAERIAPEQVRQHYLSRDTALNLAQSAIGGLSIELDNLMKRMKISELTS